jgi:peptide/nickel transport system substrate-binding protein
MEVYGMHKTMGVFLLGLVALMAFAACGGETEEVIREVPVEVIKEVEVVREVQVQVPVEQEVVKEVTKTEVVEVIATRAPEATTMRAANIGPVEFLDSAKSQSVNDTFNALMLAGLVTSDVTVTQTLPEIAGSWDIDDSGTNFTFHVRDDVTYHNGNNLVAGDIVWNWTRVREEIAERGRGKAHLALVTDFSAPDDRTFSVSTEFITPIFLTERITSLPYMSDPSAIGDIDSSPAYAGAYRFRKLVPGDKAEYELFPDHYDKQRLRGKPNTFISVPIEVDLTRIAALKAGEVDLIINVDFAHLDDIEQTTGLQLLAQPGGFSSSYLQIIFNYREGITKDKAIREAVQYAIDKEAINKVVFNGRGDIGCHPLPTQHWAYVESPCPERDPEKAKQILTDAGYDLPVTLDWVPMFVPFSKVLAQVAKQSLAEGGINAEIRVLDTPSWFEQIHYGVECGADGPECFGGLHKTFDAGDNWLGRTPDPDGMITNVFKTNEGTIESGFSGNNETRFYDPEIEKLYKAGLSTLDRDKRIEIYNEIVQAIHFGEIPVVKLQTMPRFMGASYKVKDLLVGPRGGAYFPGRWEFSE